MGQFFIKSKLMDDEKSGGGNCVLKIKVEVQDCAGKSVFSASYTLIIAYGLIVLLVASRNLLWQVFI